jgi:DTW domain-containing protein YfiP
MGRRAKSSPRCIRCRMHPTQCVCPLIPSLSLRTRVLVLMHRRERTKTTATAHLAQLALTNFETRIHGHRDTPIQLDDVLVPEQRVLLLFPTENAKPLTADVVAADPRPITLIVPDGSWGQARKMPKRIPRLAEAEAVTLVADTPSRYRLRREPVQGGLATLEAIARALGVIEGLEVRRALERPFHAMVEGTLSTRGRGG